MTGNSLPELGDGGDQGQVGGVGGQHEGSVDAVGVLDAAEAVPGVVALGPGQLGLETLSGRKQRRNQPVNPSSPCEGRGVGGGACEPTWNR